MADPKTITRLLRAKDWETLLPIIHDELGKRAEGASYYQTLDTSALIAELYIQLVERNARDWKSRNDFYAIATKAMRRIVVDYARKKSAQKRGGDGKRQGVVLQLDDFIETATVQDASRGVLLLHEALQELTTVNERQGLVVEHRFFGGFEMGEIADILGVSLITVKRDWKFAKSWLKLAMQRLIDET